MTISLRNRRILTMSGAVLTIAIAVRLYWIDIKVALYTRGSTQIRELKGLKSGSRFRGLATVTYFDAGSRTVFLQDASGAVKASFYGNGRQLRPGLLVTAEGTTAGEWSETMGLNDITIWLDKINVIGAVQLPVPISVGDSSIITQAPLYSQISGIVHTVQRQQGQLLFELSTASTAPNYLASTPGQVLVAVQQSDASNLRTLTDARVRLAGVPSLLQHAGFASHLWLCRPQDLTVLAPPASPPVLVPSIHDLIVNEKWLDSGHWIRVRGKVLARYTTGGEAKPVVILGDGSAQVPIEEIPGTETFGEGTVEVTAWPIRQRYTLVLRGASIRPAATRGYEAYNVLQPALPTITEIKGIRSLSSEQARRGFPVKVTGVVTYSYPPLDSAFIQDRQSGVFISTVDQPHCLEPGDRVMVKGLTAAGGYSPIVVHPEMTIIGRTGMPAPALVSFEEASTGIKDSVWVELKGKVHSPKPQGGRVVFNLATHLGNVLVAVPPTAGHDPTELTDTTVRIRGVFGAVFSNNRQLVGYRLFVSNSDQIRELRPATAVIGSQFTPISDLLRYSPTLGDQRAVSVRGSVTLKRPGHIYLEDTTGGLDVRADAQVRPGDLLEALGYPVAGEYGVVLDDAVVRRTGASYVKTPKVVTADQAIAGEFINRLIQIDGVLLGSATTGSNWKLLLNGGDRTFEVQMDNVEEGGRIRGLREGSTLRVAGVCFVTAENQVEPNQIYNGRVPTSFGLFVQSPTELQVIRRAPWFTHERAVLALELMGVLILLTVTWIMVMRRQVEFRTADLRRAETEREQMRTQFLEAQKMESVGRLAGGIAHDFNNLLTVINGYAGFLIKKLKDDEPLRAYADQIKIAGERAASLTKQLLAFSRKQIVEPRVLDLNTTIKDAVPMLQRLIGEDIALRTHLEVLVGQVMADPDQIHQVIMNLVVNARDAMPEGGTIDIETQNIDLDAKARAAILSEAMPGHYVLMTVTDNGHGIDEEIRHQIFEPFFTTKAAGKGTGLGLATVYGIIRQSGGWIDVLSELGVGTTFKVYLPSLDARLLVETHGKSDPTEDGDETVLVVEDQPSVRSFAKTALKHLGYHVVEAGDANAALALAMQNAEEIDLLLTDVVMPGMDGKELYRRLKELRPNLKVLFMSGYAADVIAERGVLDRGVVFLPKPFSPDELAGKVREVLDDATMPAIE